MDTRKIGDTITLDFTTHNASTGMISDADFIPICEIFEDDNDTAILSPTVEKRTNKIGNYRSSIIAIVGNGFEIGKSYNVIVSVIVNNISAKSSIASFTLDSKRNADLNDLSQIEIEEKLEPIKLETDKIQPEIIEKKNEFKADISNLALENTSQSIKDIVDGLNLELDGVAKETTLNTKASQESVDIIKERTNRIPDNPALEESAEERKLIQLDIQSISNEIKTNLVVLENIINVIKDETDKLSGIDDNVQSLENVADTIKTETNKIATLKSLSEALQNQITELNNITENIKQIENGRWLCEGSQMKFYNENNEIIATFNLYDKDGHLTDDISKVVERRKV